MCLTLNKEGERISSVNKTLHVAVEDALRLVILFKFIKK